MKSAILPRTLRRKFRLQIASMNSFRLPRWIEEVIQGIERDELLVFHPDDPHAFTPVLSQNNGCQEVLVNKRATLPISLREWLPVGCQLIRRGNELDGKQPKNVLAYYKSNLRESIISLADDCAPPGPVAFMAAIVIQQAEMFDSDEMEMPFKFIVAHELVHSFDYLRIVAPAVMNWKTFWSVALCDGCACDLALSALEDKRCFVDDYGTENELTMVSQFWPSEAKRWFAAYGAWLASTKF